MTLQQFLDFIIDEEVRIELAIYKEENINYIYESFWISDYRENFSSYKIYANYIVVGISFITEFSDSEISIEIKEK